jgi:hypothetical protein
VGLTGGVVGSVLAGSASADYRRARVRVEVQETTGYACDYLLNGGGGIFGGDRDTLEYNDGAETGPGGSLTTQAKGTVAGDSDVYYLEGGVIDAMEIQDTSYYGNPKLLVKVSLVEGSYYDEYAPFTIENEYAGTSGYIFRTRYGVYQTDSNEYNDEVTDNSYVCRGSVTDGDLDDWKAYGRTTYNEFQPNDNRMNFSRGPRCC